MKNICAMAAKGDAGVVESNVFKLRGFAFKMVIYPSKGWPHPRGSLL